MGQAREENGRMSAIFIPLHVNPLQIQVLRSLVHTSTSQYTEDLVAMQRRTSCNPRDIIIIDTDDETFKEEEIDEQFSSMLDCEQVRYGSTRELVRNSSDVHRSVGFASLL